MSSASRQGIVVRTGQFGFEIHQNQHSEKTARGNYPTNSVKHEWYDTGVSSDYDVEINDICLAPVQQFQSLKRLYDGTNVVSQQPRFITSLTGYSSTVTNKNPKELEDENVRNEMICKSLVLVGLADRAIKYEEMVKNQVDKSGVPLIQKGVRTMLNRGKDHILAGDTIIWAPPPFINPPYYGTASKCRKAIPVPLRCVKTTDYHDLETFLKTGKASPLYEKNETLASLVGLIEEVFKLGQQNPGVKGDQVKNLLTNALTSKNGTLKKRVTNVLNFPRREWKEKTDRKIGKAITGGAMGHEFDILVDVE